MNHQATAPDGSSVLSQRFPGRTKRCCASRPHMMQLLISPAPVPTEQGPGASENLPVNARTYLNTPLSDKSKVQTLVFLHKLCDETIRRKVSQSVGKSKVAIEKIWSPTQSYKASKRFDPKNSACQRVEQSLQHIFPPTWCSHPLQAMQFFFFFLHLF